MKIAVHPLVFHADDAFAVASMKLLFPSLEVVRSRDVATLAAADMRIDVGGKNDPSTGDYDHHMKGGAGIRENGIPFASFGLIWKRFGAEIAGSQTAADEVDRVLVQAVDAADNGVKMWNGLAFDQRFPFTVSDAISSYNPSWQVVPQDFDGAFETAVQFAQAILKNVIAGAQGIDQARAEAFLAIANAKESTDQAIITFDRYVPWQGTVVANTPAEVHHVVFPTTPTDWKVQAIPTTVDGTDQRKPLPETWAGKPAVELQALTGVSDAVFCHAGRFIAGAKSRAGALELARLATSA